MKLSHSGLLVVTSAILLPVFAGAQTDVTPNFGTVTTAPTQTPGAWYTDRYAPATFQSLPSYAGRTGVLDIGISSNDASTNRPAPYSSAFYNTQGRKLDLNATGPSSLFADVFIPESWSNSANGYRRTDMWGTLLDGSGNVTGYPIIGFTNQGGIARFRTWDDNTGWTDVTNTINFGGWNTLGFNWDGANLATYFVNGVSTGTTDVVTGSTTFGNTIMQAYNFGQDFGENASPSYDAYWSNTVTTTPEPSSLALLGTGLVALVPMVRRRRR